MPEAKTEQTDPEGQERTSETDDKTPTTPTTLEEALARITALETERKELRRENQARRTKNETLTTEVASLTEKLTAAEQKAVKGTENAAELLAAKTEEIKTLKAQIAERDEKLGGYADIEKTEREALLQKIPATKREALKDISLDALRVIADDIKTEQRESPATDKSKGQQGTTTSLEEAAKTKDPAAINAALDAELARLDPNFRPVHNPNPAANAGAGGNGGAAATK